MDSTYCLTWTGRAPSNCGRSWEDAVSVFILPPSAEVLAERLSKRGRDPDDVIASRMRKAAAEISHWAEYDYVLVNENLDHCEAELRAIVTAERLRKDRQVGLMDRVRALNTEFEAMS